MIFRKFRLRCLTLDVQPLCHANPPLATKLPLAADDPKRTLRDDYLVEKYPLLRAAEARGRTSNKGKGAVDAGLTSDNLRALEQGRDPDCHDFARKRNSIYRFVLSAEFCRPRP